MDKFAKQFVIERNGHRFEFTVFEEVDRYGNLCIQYALPGYNKPHYAKDYKDGIIYFWSLELDGKKVRGIRIDDESLKKELDEIKTRAVASRKEKEQYVKAYVPKKVRFAVGGDTFHVYVTTDEVNLPGVEPDVIKELEEIMNSLDISEIRNICRTAKSMGDFRTCLYAPDGWYEIEYDRLITHPAVAKYVEERRRTQQEAERKRAEREKEKASMIVRVIKQGTTMGEEPDPYVLVEITDPQTGESARYNCRNIFDFGYVVNPAYSVAEGLEPGGLAVKQNDKWYWQYFGSSGWRNVRQMTDFEVKAVQYLWKFPPLPTDIRM
jgi:hypothetical protein